MGELTVSLGEKKQLLQENKEKAAFIRPEKMSERFPVVFSFSPVHKNVANYADDVVFVALHAKRCSAGSKWCRQFIQTNVLFTSWPLEPTQNLSESREPAGGNSATWLQPWLKGLDREEVKTVKDRFHTDTAADVTCEVTWPVDWAVEMEPSDWTKEEMQYFNNTKQNN